MTDSDTLAAVERWFPSRAIPHFIDHHSAGRDVFARVLAELPQVAGFLTAFSGFYFTVYVLADATYRKELLDEVLVQLRQAFAVRAVYLASRGA